MSVYKILEMGNGILREKSEPVSKITRNTHRLLDKMAATMYQARGIGLAAPQVGVSKRIIIVDIGSGLLELINPDIQHMSTQAVTENEGCLSIPGVVGDVARPYYIEVKWLDRNGKQYILKADGLLARVIQHEIDHLNGILFIDRATNVCKVEK